MQNLKFSTEVELGRRFSDLLFVSLAKQTRVMKSEFLNSKRWAELCESEKIIAITRKIAPTTIESGYLRMLDILRRWGTFYSFDELAELVFPNLDRVEKEYIKETNTIAIKIYLKPEDRLWTTADYTTQIISSDGRKMIFKVPTTEQKVSDYRYLCNELTQRRMVTVEAQSV